MQKEPKPPRRTKTPEPPQKPVKARSRAKKEVSEELPTKQAPKPRIKLPSLNEGPVLWGTVLVLVSIAREESSMKQPLRIVQDDQTTYYVQYLVKRGLIKAVSGQSKSAEFSLTPSGTKLIQSLETIFRLLINV